MTSTSGSTTRAVRDAADEAMLRARLAASEMDEQIERARVELDRLDVTIRRATKEHPLLTIGAAAALGYLTARLMARR